MKRLILIPLTLCLSTPQYFVLSIHQGYYTYRYGESANIVWPMLAITVGLILSIAFNKFGMGPFLILSIGVLAYTLGCAILLFGSLKTSSPQSYLYAFLVTCFTIGLVQHNLASVFGDQYITSTLNQFLAYAFMNMIGICSSRIVSVLVEQKEFSNEINWLKKDNYYPIAYQVCLISSCIGLGILILMFIGRKYFVVRSLVYKPLMDSVLDRFRIFCSIFTPLIGFFIIMFELEHKIFIQANELNRNVTGNFYIEHFQLHIIYYSLTLLFVPVSFLFEVRKSKSFEPIIFGCILICLANFYYGLLHCYAKESYNVLNIAVEPKKTALQILNGFDDIYYSIEKANLVGNCPYGLKLGPFRILTDVLPFLWIDFTDQEVGSVVSLNLWRKPINGQLVSITIVPFNFSTLYSYPERTYRAPSGYALIRIIINSGRTEFSPYYLICLRSAKIEICPFRSYLWIIEIPPDLYNLTFNNETIATYFLGSGSSNSCYYVCMDNLVEDCTSIIPFIPPFKVTIHQQFVLFILLSMAKGMIYSAGLHMSYLIGSDNQKPMYIGCLYLFYLAAWFLYLAFGDLVEFFANELRNPLTIILLGGSFWLYYNCHYRAHLLNRIESVENEV